MINENHVFVLSLITVFPSYFAFNDICFCFPCLSSQGKSKEPSMMGVSPGDPAVMMSYGDSDLSGADALSLGGGLGQKGDFDRRKKKK